MIERRATLAGLGALALPGCATTQLAKSPPARSCLPRVEVAPDRVIRTVAGLRPYRRAGYVVRAEPLGDKRLVHNYGHGGAGISLSWGSSREAVALGLPGHQGAVAVIGAGVMGLTTARLVQAAGFPVTIYTEALPPETTSNIAGGQILAYGHFDDDAVTPEWRARADAAADYTRRRLQIMVGDDYGVRWLPTYDETRWTRTPPANPDFPGRRLLARDEHPFPFENVVRYTTMYVETGRFLRQLTRDLLAVGGAIRVRAFAAPSELAALPERLVFNCTGIGARALFGDTALVPVRGQLAVLLPQPEIQYAVTGPSGYMFPRPDGILLGGTYEPGESDATAQPDDIARIVASHARVFNGFRCAA